MKRTYNGNKGSGDAIHVSKVEKSLAITPKIHARQVWKDKYECHKTKGKHTVALGHPNLYSRSIPLFNGEWIVTDWAGRPKPLKDQYRYVHCSECGANGFEYLNGKISF